LIDATGKVVISIQFEDNLLFNSGQALVRKDNKSYYINRLGKWVKDPAPPRSRRDERNEGKTGKTKRCRPQITEF
jgi:hypothetical protein